MHTFTFQHTKEAETSLISMYFYRHGSRTCFCAALAEKGAKVSKNIFNLYMHVRLYKATTSNCLAHLGYTKAASPLILLYQSHQNKHVVLVEVNECD